METPHLSVEPYKYFWLHFGSNSAEVSDTPGIWGNKNPGNGWNDGEHYVGRIREYCVGKRDDVLVIVRSLIRIESDDGEFKWHPVASQGRVTAGQNIFKFEDCNILGMLGKSRARFKSKNGEFIILSSDPEDSYLIEALIEEASTS